MGRFLYKADKKIGVGKAGWSRPPLPPNRTGGSPASGFPVDGPSSRKDVLTSGRRQRPLRPGDSGPQGPRLLTLPPSSASRTHSLAIRLSPVFSAAEIAPTGGALTAVYCDWSSLQPLHLPASLCSRPVTALHRSYGGADFCAAACATLIRTDLFASCVGPSRPFCLQPSRSRYRQPLHVTRWLW